MSLTLALCLVTGVSLQFSAQTVAVHEQIKGNIWTDNMSKSGSIDVICSYTAFDLFLYFDFVTTYVEKDFTFIVPNGFKMIMTV